MDPEEFLQKILRRMEHVPPEEQMEQMYVLLEAALRQMDRATVLEFRASVSRTAGRREPVAGSVLDLIDGHLVLREIAGGSIDQSEQDRRA